MTSWPNVQMEKFPLPFEGEEYLGHIAYRLRWNQLRIGSPHCCGC